MNHPQAHNLLDERRAGADLPQERINMALYLTGDLSENELLRVSPNTQHNKTNNNRNLPNGNWTV